MRGLRTAGIVLWALGAAACAGAAPVAPSPAAAPEPRPSAIAPAQPPPPATTASVIAAPSSPPDSVHAIFDAGSSGLRLQLYRITRRPDGSCSASERTPVFAGKAAGGGLADMTSQRVEAPGAPFPQFPEAESTLAGLWSKVTSENRAALTGAALLGTGGFRDPARIERGAARVMGRLDMVVAGWRTELGKPAGESWLARTIDGRDEAIFAWLAARELGAKPGHRTIETGGQTCQYAIGAGEDDGRSDDLGTDFVKKWAEAPGDLQRCVAAPLQADACIAAFGRRFARSKMITGILAKGPVPDESELWTMGASWENLFADMEKTRSQPPPAAWSSDQDPPVGASVSVAEIYAFAKKVCAVRPPAYPGSLFEPKYWCMRASHAVAFAVAAYGGTFDGGTTSAVARFGAKRVVNGKESYPRGAAVSGAVFRDCGAAAPVAEVR